MEKEHAMKKPLIAAMAAGLMGLSVPAFADEPLGESAQAGSQSAAGGSTLVVEGSNALAQGNLVGGSVAVPLGAASMAVGSASAGVGLIGDAALAPMEAAFGDEPLEITEVTVMAQPAPNVPYEAGAPAPKR
jgi:hypothetical protein